MATQRHTFHFDGIALDKLDIIEWLNTNVGPMSPASSIGFAFGKGWTVTQRENVRVRSMTAWKTETIYWVELKNDNDAITFKLAHSERIRKDIPYPAEIQKG